MKTATSILVVTLILVLISCSSVNVTTDYDPEIDFSKYKTYLWYGGEMPADDQLSANPLVKKRVASSVEKALESKGFTKGADGQADLVVIIHAGTKEKMQVTNYGYGGYGYGRYGGGWGGYGGGTDVHYYDETTLVVDIAIVAGTSLSDLLSNADEAILYGQHVPVEFTSFAANVNNNGDVILNWTTATELNNQMFEIERRSEEGQYIKIGYVNGHGTTTENQEYSYIDNSVETGTYFYRLKQIDFLGTYEYSDEIEVEVNGPLTFGLEQNYPNPFNPSTHIKYNIPESGIVKLAIYNTLGEEVAVLVDGMVEAGFYEVTFDASHLPSGAYFYRLQSDKLNQVKKMLLMK